MSAYSEWKYGLITDDQYRASYAREQWEQDHLEDLEDHPQTIPQSLEEIASEMCNSYCKWPLQWDEEAQGCELSESDVCANCPLNRLV